MAEKRFREHERVAVLFLPARESCTVMSMQDGSRVSHSVGEEEVEEGLVGGDVTEHTWISINAEPKFPEWVNGMQYQANIQ